MTREEAIAYGNRVIDLGLNDETQAFCEMAIKALEQERYYKDLAKSYEKTITKLTKAIAEQESILDKIYVDIQRLRGCSCSCSDGIIDDVEDILDKYKGESEG